jgi:hypothetical protein
MRGDGNVEFGGGAAEVDMVMLLKFVLFYLKGTISLYNSDLVSW